MMFVKLRSSFATSIILVTLVYAASNAQELSGAELLQRYRQSLSNLQSLSMHVAIVVDSNDNSSFPHRLDLVLRQDGTRNEWIGQRLVTGSQGEFDLTISKTVKEIVNDRLYLGLRSAYLDQHGIPFAEVTHDYSETQQRLVENPNRGGPLFGRMYGSNHRSIADLLGEAADLHILRKEDINGNVCLVVEGTSEYGTVTAWIAPEKGYSPVKWSIEKNADHRFNDTPVSQIVERWHALFEVTEFHEVVTADGTVFAPKAAHFSHRITHLGGVQDADHYAYTTDDIRLKPDFDALGAFKVELPDGTRVWNRDFQDVHFEWRSGGIVAVVDQEALKAIDQQVRQMADDKTKSVRETRSVTDAPHQSAPVSHNQQETRDIMADTHPAVASQPRFLYVLVGGLIILLATAVVVRKVLGWPKA